MSRHLRFLLQLLKCVITPIFCPPLSFCCVQPFPAVDKVKKGGSMDMNGIRFLSLLRDLSKLAGREGRGVEFWNEVMKINNRLEVKDPNILTLPYVTVSNFSWPSFLVVYFEWPSPWVFFFIFQYEAIRSTSVDYQFHSCEEDRNPVNPTPRPEENNTNNTAPPPPRGEIVNNPRRVAIMAFWTTGSSTTST